MKLYIPLKVWQEMQGYAITSMPNEITGFGTIKRIKDDLVVDQLFIPQQITSPTYCESDMGAVTDIIFDVIEQDSARAGDLKFRWHSHADGEVFWSKIDEHDIRTWEGPWVVNLVMNIRGEYLARLDLFREFQLFDIPIEVSIVVPVPDDTLERCIKENLKKVRHAPFNRMTEHRRGKRKSQPDSTDDMSVKP